MMAVDTGTMMAVDTIMMANLAVAPPAWGTILQGDAGIEHQDQLCADLKLRLNGGNGDGPAQQPKRSAED